MAQNVLRYGNYISQIIKATRLTFFQVVFLSFLA